MSVSVQSNQTTPTPSAGSSSSTSSTGSATTQTNSGQSPASQTKASKLGKLLDALAGLLEQIKAEEGPEDAGEQILDLFRESDLDIVELLEVSREVQEALAELKKAIENSLKFPQDDHSAEAEEKRRKLAAALARLDGIYLERNRRQLEQNFSDLWRLIYLERRQRHADVDPDMELAPAGLDPGLVRAALSTTEELHSARLLELLSDQTFEAEPAEKALLLHEAAYRLLDEIRTASQTSVPDAATLSQIDVLGEQLMQLRSELAAR